LGGNTGPSVYTVTFDKNDGNTNAVPAAKTVTAPATHIDALPTPPAKVDHTFVCWNTRADGRGNPFTTSTTVNADITVYAQWTAILPPGSFTVTFRLLDGTMAVWETKTVTAPATAIGAADFPASPSRSGYTFTGWNTAANGSGNPFTASTTVSGDIAVYAQWTAVPPPSSFTVTFRLNDGTVAVWETKTVTAPATAIGAADFPASPSWSGYTFTGWNTAANGSGTSFTATTTVTGNMTVYAQWTASGPYTVTFRLNDGTDTIWTARTVTTTAIGTADFPGAPSRTGYNFEGWNTATDSSGSDFTASTAVTDNMTVYAQWTAVPPGPYTVTFRLNDGTEAVWTTKTVTAPATSIGTTNFPANPSQTGYVFSGWNIAANGTGTAFTASTTVTDNMTVYAQWTAVPPSSYTVTFRLNDGTEAVWTTKTVTAPATSIGTTNFPTVPSRTGYTFTGWNTSANGSGTPFTASTSVNANITVYAQWTGEAYTVTFKSNYAPDTTLYTKTVTVPATAIGTANFPTNPSRTGYAFSGWNTATDGTGTAFTASTTVNADITVYAQWTGETYTVTFKSNYAPDTTLYTKTVTVPATAIGTVNFPANPSRTGYNFEGWNTTGGGSGASFTASTIVNADITVYAQWTGETYTVTFKSNYAPDTTLYTKTVTVPATAIGSANFPANPSRTGYVFSGWNTAANGTGTAFTASTTVTGNMTVYAQWTGETYTVTFKSNYAPDTTLYTKTVTVPATTIGAVNFPANPSRTGYNFEGWNTTAGGSGASFTASTIVDADITVYAQWTIPPPSGSFTVTFRLNDGTETNWAVRTVTPPVDTITGENFPANPSRTDYTFGGWNTAANGSGNPFTASTSVNANITVYAQWTGNTYTVLFKSNDGADTTLYTKTVTIPATTIGAVNFPANPSRTGYTFTGWNTAANGSGTSFSASTSVNANITVYAQWTASGPYTVIFKMNDGTEATWAAKIVTPPVDTIIVGDFPAAPSRTGYTFTGWNTAANGSGTPFTVSTTVNTNITVYAQWTGKTYTVLFKSNDGADTTLHTKTVTVPATTIGAVNFPANPSRTDYTFGGWNTAANGSGNPFTASTTVNTNITVYAQWTGKTYTVLFKSNDGANTTLYTKTVTVPATTIGAVNFPANPSRTGYTFTGWNTAANGSGTSFSASTSVNADITVYAQWTGKTYTVLFKSNDDTDTTLYTKTVTVPATTIGAVNFPANPSRTDYTFAGWNTAANGSGTPFTASTSVNTNITVYAQWTGETYTVTFKSNYAPDTTLHTKTVTVPATTIGSEIFPTDPTRTGYTFAGWNTVANGSGSVFTATSTVNTDTTVYAQWTGKTYTVLFKSNDGADTTLHTKTVTVPATTIGAANFPTDPTRTGYNFAGWNTAANGSGTAFTASTTVTGNMPVYAKWNTYSYTVTFDNNGGNTAASPASKTVTSPATTVGTLPAPPARTGYIFGGWTTGSGSSFTASTTVTGNITVYAKWNTYSYTVTFNNNGGNTAASPASKTVTSPATTIDILPAPPTWTGSSFVGWNTASNGLGDPFTASTAVTGNITVYALWTGGIITLNPDAGDGVFSETDFTLSKSGSGNPTSQIINITGSGYTNPRWIIDGALKGTGTSITISAVDYGLGGHNLTLIISKNGVSWSKDIAFTVAN
jgi:uncharacterized repeat protein (TIGR02543 family)